MLKQALAFVGGLAVGAGTTYLICKKKYDQKMNQELEDMKAYYEGVMVLRESDIRKDQIEKDIKADADFNEKPEGPTEDTYTNYGNLANPYKRNSDSTPPSDADMAGRMENDEPDMEEEELRQRKAAKARRAAKMRDQYPPEDEDDEEYEDDEDEEIQMEGPFDPSMAPYEVTLESFNNDFTYFDKLTVNYYPMDNLLVDENEEYVENSDRLFGSFHESHRVAGAETYVRNESIGTDFLIITKPGSYLGKEDYN